MNEGDLQLARAMTSESYNEEGNKFNGNEGISSNGNRKNLNLTEKFKMEKANLFR